MDDEISPSSTRCCVSGQLVITPQKNTSVCVLFDNIIEDLIQWTDTVVLLRDYKDAPI